MHKKIVILMSLAFIVAVCLVGAIAVFLINNKPKLSEVAIVPTTNPTTESNTVSSKIYFSKDPESYEDDLTFTVGVQRDIDKTKPIETALTELLKGPTTTETNLGLRNPIVLSGESSCN